MREIEKAEVVIVQKGQFKFTFRRNVEREGPRSQNITEWRKKDKEEREELPREKENVDIVTDAELQDKIVKIVTKKE